MTYTMSAGALNSAQSNPIFFIFSSLAIWLPVCLINSVVHSKYRITFAVICWSNAQRRVSDITRHIPVTFSPANRW